MSNEYIRTLQFQKMTMESVSAQLTSGLVGLESQAGTLTDAMFAGQHVVLEGEPGIGKTELVNNLGVIVLGETTPYPITSRLQGASDRQPADFLGSVVYNQKTQDFETRMGPIFAHFVLADEINRNHTKTQAALHEAMAEGFVSLGDARLNLPAPFMVLATQNTHEFGQGTSNMSDALLDRFGASAYFSVPTLEERIAVGTEYTNGAYRVKPTPVLEIANLPRMQAVTSELQVAPSAIVRAAKIIDYLAKMPHKDIELVSRGHRSVQTIIRLAQANAIRSGKAVVDTGSIDNVVDSALIHRIKTVGDEANFAKKQEVLAKVKKVV